MNSTSNPHPNDATRGNVVAISGTFGSAERSKLRELGERSGRTILDVGGSDPLALSCALAGALTAHRAGRGPTPQSFSLRPGIAERRAAATALRGEGLLDYCVLWDGSLGRMPRELRLTPTLALLNGASSYSDVWAQLNVLSTLLAPGAFIVCAAAADASGARCAIAEWIDGGRYLPAETIGSALVLRHRPEATRPGRVLKPQTFAQLRDALLTSLFAESGAAGARDTVTALRDVKGAARSELGDGDPPSGASGYGGWPFGSSDGANSDSDTADKWLPPFCPSGRPWPRVSIVTPSFNQGEYIEETILSVLKQGYPNVEHLIIDGGSTDATPAVLERYRDRLAYVTSEPDQGQGDALNKGFARATGDILTWLNSDDRLAPGALAAAALAFDHSGADLVAGVCEIFSGDSTLERHITCCDDGPLPLEDLLDIECCWQAGQFFYQPEVLFTRKLWQRAGARIDQRWYFSMDYELWLRFAEQGARLKVIGRPIAQFRVHPEQKTTTTAKFLAELIQVRDDFFARTGRDQPEAPSREFGELNKRIVFFNDMGFRAGAGIAHGRLAEALHEAGNAVLPIAATETSTYDRTQPVTNATIIAEIERAAPDLVVMGNLHSAALGPELLGEIAARWPTALVLHDQWALTGRCAYTGGCEMYLSGCDHTCPTPDEYPALAPERIRAAWEVRRRIYESQQPPALLTNSAWMADFARTALAGIAPPIEAIRLGLRTDVFHPRDRRLCREQLDLPADQFIIMTSGTSSADPRKGLAHLAAALEQLSLPDVLVVAVGHHDDSRRPLIPGMRAMGYLSNPRQLAMLYAAADLFVGPSLQEAFGQVFVEAAACGTPSVGYPVGGVPEAIADGVSGYVATSMDSKALADEIAALYRDPALRRRLSTWGRLHAENEFSTASACRKFYAALERTGLRKRIGLRRKIRLEAVPPAPLEVRQIASEYPRWRAVDGFLDWEGPYPKDNLARCRWALWPRSRFEIQVDAPGPHALLIECRNYYDGQRVRILHKQQVIWESDIPLTRNERDHVIYQEVNLPPGRHIFEMQLWKWDMSRPNRPTALLILGIGLVPIDPLSPTGSIRLIAAASSR